ncbi:hypothetical protein WA1_20530 [Scytonema hofmannii PCC 7110]|uniref:Uncharacterized protein n=1 Tax=Scytonema hofmannii PCC 7110 TaxID=128403 RepID=A0A139XCD3_9CYAN|nr:hypothetical protein [Scytonema hofmannii]KYC42358.1 hypothetical protein WA1_20530 [Scytonema hofmannii PCC 7110]
MATENSRIVTYLPPELAERLKQFCDEKQTKTSEAIKQILSEFFGKPPSSSTSTKDSEPQIAGLEERLSILDNITQRISALESSFARLQEMNVPPSVPAQDIPPVLVESAPESHPEASKTSDETPKVQSQKKSKNGAVPKTSKTSDETPKVQSQKKSKNGAVPKTSKTSEETPKAQSRKQSKDESVPETSKTSSETPKAQSRKQSKDESALETSETSDVTPVESSKESTASQTCTVNELAKRLSVTKTTISRNKDREHFRSWSQGHDPEGVAWEFHPEEMLFYSLKE